MRKRILNSALTLALFILVLAATATAQSAISPEKRALIKEMMVVTDVQKSGDVMMKAVVDRFENEAPTQIAQRVNALTDLTPQEREKMTRELTEGNTRFTKRFRELTEKLDWSQLLEQLMMPIIDKYYTEDDLKNMIAFYKTPTGKKVLEVMPQMMTDILFKSDEIIRPKFEAIAKQILDEEKKRLQQ